MGRHFATRSNGSQNLFINVANHQEFVHTIRF
jgi:hypothetical protein